MSGAFRAAGILIACSCAAAGQTHASSVLLENGRGQSQAYSGVARLSSSAGTCTGFLISAAAEAPAAARAYLMTAGHCVDRDPQQVIAGRPASGFTVSFNYFIDTPDRRVQAGVRTISYSTMKGLDLAVLELDKTYGELIAQGIQPLRLSSSVPREGDRVVNAGIPVTEIPPGEAFVRRSACILGRSANLIEFSWHWWDISRNDCPDIKGGSSGSPLMLERDGTVIGVIGTTTAGSEPGGGGFDCYLNRPCEIVPGGYRVEEDTSYSSPAAGLAACFGAAGFNVDLAGCPLDNGRQLRIDRPPGRVFRPPATWQATLSGDAFTYYRYKSVRAGAGDCREAAGYGLPIRLADAGRIDGPIDADDGIYFLCVIGGNSPQPDASWQNPRYATAVLAIIDSTGPIERPRYQIQTEANSHRLSFEFAPPELSSYSYKIGSPAATRCEDPAGYVVYRRVPIVLRPTEDQALVCAKAEDEAGNTSPPLTIRLDGERLLPLGVVNAASFRPGPIAPGQLVSVFGVNLPPDTIALTDSTGATRSPQVLYASRQQINLVIPPGTAPGPGRLSISEREWSAVEVAPSAPGLFLAGSSGTAPAIFLVRIRADGSRTVEPAFVCQGAVCSLTPVAPGPEPEEHLLEIYATGIRGTAGAVRARIGRQPVEVVSAGPRSGIEGLDQVILRLPRPFLLRGYQPVIIEANVAQAPGLRMPSANRVYLWFK